MGKLIGRPPKDANDLGAQYGRSHQATVRRREKAREKKQKDAELKIDNFSKIEAQQKRIEELTAEVAALKKAAAEQVVAAPATGAYSIEAPDELDDWVDCDFEYHLPTVFDVDEEVIITVKSDDAKKRIMKYAAKGQRLVTMKASLSKPPKKKKWQMNFMT